MNRKYSKGLRKIKSYKKEKNTIREKQYKKKKSEKKDNLNRQIHNN